jgi:hypothetical protein
MGTEDDVKRKVEKELHMQGLHPHYSLATRNSQQHKLAAKLHHRTAQRSTAIDVRAKQLLQSRLTLACHAYRLHKLGPPCRRQPQELLSTRSLFTFFLLSFNNQEPATSERL